MMWTLSLQVDYRVW